MTQKFTILFDLDGTLVDTAPDLMNAHNHVMRKFGYETKSTDDIRKLVGQGAGSLIGRSVWGQAKKELKKIPIFKSILSISGSIFVDRENTNDAIDSLDELKSDLKNTPRSVVVFPEGTRSNSNQLKRFKKGAAVLSINTGLPIIPVYIMGSFDWWNTKNFRKNSNKIIVNFGEPIITDDKQYKDRENITNSIKKEILKLQNDES